MKLAVIKTGKEVNERFWMTSNGKRLFLQVYLEPLRNESGEITGVCIATVDLTEQKTTESALSASEIRYRRLFEAAKDGILILDAYSGKVV